MLRSQSNGGSAMKRIYLTAVAFASLALGGCATYDYVGDTAPGGYYHGRPSTQYYDPYGGYYGGGGVYSGYGYYGPYRYGGYSSYPYYGYHGPYYPYYPSHPRPPRPDTPKPPGGGGGNRPPPWRDPTGRWHERGSHPQIPQQAPQGVPAPGQPRVGEGGYRPPRVAPSPSAPRTAERPQRMERSAPSRMERSEPAPRPQRRPDNAIRQQER